MSETYKQWEAAKLRHLSELGVARRKLAKQQERIEQLESAVNKVAMHRGVICAGETSCGNPDCKLVEHNHVVFKTKAARDCWQALTDLLSTEGEGNE